MAKAPLGFWDYLSEAFNLRYPVPGMGALPLNKMGVAGTIALGLLNPGFWFLGAGLEVCYLWMLSTDTRFQKVVQSRRLNLIEQDKAVRINEMVRTLDRPSVTRLEALNANLAQINRLMDMNSEGTMEFVRETKQKTLGQLPVLFLKLLVTRRLICESLGRTDADSLKRELRDLERQLESPDIGEALIKSVRGTIEIKQKRLENIRRAQDNMKLVEMELNRIENQVQLIREEIALDRSPEALSAGIDRINSTLGETEQWVNMHSEFLNRLGGDQALPVEEPPLLPASLGHLSDTVTAGEEASPTPPPPQGQTERQ
ncbi:MAG TPA: hypothetical protein PKM25_02115 [Candidatus Ozemobacteraceae bacterium]|nr:hypothetical protein [Candidatus Ozemobacteraceae bacterium]